MVKPRLYGEDRATEDAALWTLKTVLVGSLKMLHPFMPFITEEIFDNLTDEESIMISVYPEYSDDFCFPEDAAEIESIKEAVRAIRNLRSGMDVPPSRKAAVYAVSEDAKVRAAFEATADVFKALAGASGLTVQTDRVGIEPNAVSTVTSNATIYIPLNDLVDVEKEKERLQKEVKRLEGELKRSRGMLSNEKFVAKAPAAKIEEERAKLATYEEMMKKVSAQLASLG